MKLNSYSRRLTLGLASSLLLMVTQFTACTRPVQDDSDTTAISNRPQTADRFIAILKLQNPALLEVARRDGGVTKIDADLRDAIIAEQAELEAALQQLSSEIKVLYRYRFVLNGLAIVAPKALEEKFRRLTGVSYVESEGQFAEPMRMEAAAARASGDITQANSVTFIGGKRIHDELKVKNAAGEEIRVTGKGIKVGIIDTGIDFTHAMFGGAGTTDAFQAIDPNVGDGVFPTAKITGGIDLVGKDFNSASAKFADHIPVPDNNPIDLRGHGSHVAGTVGGLGDGANTYSGVAPDADLHAIKVFGDVGGSTSDSVVIAALEYAADPNNDLDPADALQVVNLSLGSGYGMPHVLYSESIGNLSKGGTITVASAGNSGPTSYIVGAPSTAPEAISVAASIDNMDHNWKFGAVVFSTPENPRIVAEAVEAAISKPIQDAGDVQGKLVHIGLANVDLTDAQKAALAGNIALIDRGVVTFGEKLVRAAAAGAIGVVVANNREGDPIVMGGDGSVDVPAIMITKTLGDALKSAIAAGGEARIVFKTDIKVEKPELIDNLTSFSSRGPRSVDSLLKPEISAPGANIISAKAGGGAEGVRMSGTSMAAPHIAGVTALLRQIHPTLSPAQVKALLTATAKPIADKAGVPYAVAYMGAGRVEAFAAATAAAIFEPATLSLGEVAVETRKTVRQVVSLRNLSGETQTLKVIAETDNGLALTLPTTITVAPGRASAIPVLARIEAPADQAAAREMGGFIRVLKSDGSEVAKIPVLAVAKRTSRVTAEQLKVLASSEADAAGAAAELTLANKGNTTGQALVFNLLGRDERKTGPVANAARNASCDVESAGVRIVKSTTNGETVDLLQIAVKLYQPVTTWNLCEITALIDANGDGVAEQELLATDLSAYVPGAQANTFRSALVDAARMRDIRQQYELNFPNASEDYTESILDIQPVQLFDHSTLAVLSVNTALLAKTPSGEIRVKVGALSTDTSSPEADDFLKKGEGFQKVATTETGLAYHGMPLVTDVRAGESVNLPLTRGTGKGSLIVYMPHNTSLLGALRRDEQSKSPRVRYEP